MILILSIDLLSIVPNVTPLKCFIQFACTNLYGSQEEGVNFLICFRKRGYTERGGSLRKGGVPTLDETMIGILPFLQLVPSQGIFD